jgi:restriction system protein
MDIDFGRHPASARVEPSFTNPDPGPVRATTWSLDVFGAIEWRRFETVCEALFAQAGFRTESQSHGADGGGDIWLYSARHGTCGHCSSKH